MYKFLSIILDFVNISVKVVIALGNILLTD